MVTAVLGWSIECLCKTILQNSQENTGCRVRITIDLARKLEIEGTLCAMFPIKTSRYDRCFVSSM